LTVLDSESTQQHRQLPAHFAVYRNRPTQPGEYIMLLAPASMQPDQSIAPIQFQMITPSQCAEIIQVPVEEIEGLVESGQLPGYRLQTGQIRLDLSDLKEFALANRTIR